MIGFRPVTHGEHLYIRVVDLFIENGAALTNSLSAFRNSSLVGNRCDAFADYCTGLYYFNLTARLIKAAKAVLADPNGSEFTYRGSFLTFLVNQCGITESQFGRFNVNKLISFSFAAAQASGEKISKEVKSLVRAPFITLECYICGKELFVNSADSDDAIEYEHIWPSSYGGDSVIANLLPACSGCNRAKGSMMLWQDSWKHSLVLPPDPSLNDLTEVTRSMKVALHRKKIFDYAATHFVTLKDAALEVGPADFSALAPIEPSDATDFFTIQF